MKTVKTLTADVLEVTARELNGDDTYTFKVEEFENGLILVRGDSTHDWFFGDRSEIEPCGNGIVVDITETGETTSWTTQELLSSVQGSMKEFGLDSVPEKHAELWK